MLGRVSTPRLQLLLLLVLLVLLSLQLVYLVMLGFTYSTCPSFCNNPTQFLFALLFYRHALLAAKACS